MMVCKPIVNSNYITIPVEMTSLAYYSAQELMLLLIYWSSGKKFKVRTGYLVRRTGWSESTVKRYRSSLVKKGFLYLVEPLHGTDPYGALLFSSPEHRSMFEYRYAFPSKIDYQKQHFMVDGKWVHFDILRGAVTDAYIEGVMEARRLGTFQGNDEQKYSRKSVRRLMSQVRKVYGDEFEKKFVITAYGTLIDAPEDTDVQGKLDKLMKLLESVYNARKTFGNEHSVHEEDDAHERVDTVEEAEEDGTHERTDENEKVEENSVDTIAMELAKKLDAYLLERFTFHKTKPSSLKQWAVEIRRMMTRDGVPPEAIADVLDWIFQEDDFWWVNIRSGKKLRMHFPRIYEQMRHKERKKGLLPYLVEKYGTDTPFARLDGELVCVHDIGGGMLELVKYNTGEKLTKEERRRIEVAWRAGKI